MAGFVTGNTGLATRWHAGRALWIALAAGSSACAYADNSLVPANTSSTAEPGYLVTTRIAKLARYDQEVDIDALARAFDMPALLPTIGHSGAMVWNGPFSKNDKRISGHYSPGHSSLGIRGISIVWQPVQGGFFRELAVALRPGQCPDRALLQTVLGSTPRELETRPTDGGPGPSGTATFFSMPQSHGKPVSVSYYNGDTCQLHVGRLPD